jgi:hypothetical protein
MHQLAAMRMFIALGTQQDACAAAVFISPSVSFERKKQSFKFRVAAIKKRHEKTLLMLMTKPQVCS